MENAKMKKVTIKAPEPKPEAEKAKRIYRSALDIARAHDGIFKQKKAYRDVFLPDAIMLRDRLQEYCEKLLFYCPLEYGRKAEELLWRKAFYEIIQLMKHNRKHMVPNSSLENAFRTHLASALGYYHHLLCRLQSEFDLNLAVCVDFYYIAESRTHRKPHHSSRVEASADVQRWAVKCCHRCLVYLGDLARYQHDFAGVSCRTLSQRYYYQAVTLCPELGMPFNQLGTLAGSGCYGLNAAYYYIRCLLSSSTFEGAHGNLVRLLERSRRRFRELNDQPIQKGLSLDQQVSRDVKRFVVRLMYLLDIFYSKSHRSDGKYVQQICQSTLHDFNLCMFRQESEQHSSTTTSANSVGHSADDKPNHLSNEMVFKIIVICLAMIHVMQKNGDQQVAAAIAFSLALFSHILNHTIIRLQSALYELEHPRPQLPTLPSSEDDVIADSEEADEKQLTAVRRTSSLRTKRHRPARHEPSKDVTKANDNDASDWKKTKKSSRLRLARRRRRHDSGSVSESEVYTHDTQTQSDLSEGEVSEHEGSGRNQSNSALLASSTGSSSSSSSMSDSDSDGLMVSQELEPGFNTDCHLKLNEHVSQSQLPLQPDFVANSARPANLTTHCNTADESHLEPATAAAVATANSLSDISEYLKDIPLDWLSDAANLLSHTLQFTCLSPNLLSSDVSNGNSAGVDDVEVSAIVRGAKQVCVPPGFEQSTESQHVMELGEKLASFDIETDTDASVYPTDTENSTVTESEVDTEADTDRDSVVDRCETDSKRIERLVEVSANESLLCSVKVYCDWMRINPHIIATCAKISSSLWYRLSVLLNFLPTESDVAKIEGNCGSELQHRLVSELSMLKGSVMTEDGIYPNITVPVMEDVHLRKFPPVDVAHNHLDFTCLRNSSNLTTEQQALVRVCSLRAFGYFISQLHTVKLTFDDATASFCGPQPTAAAASGPDQQADQNMANAEARRNQLMRDMAQLRLQDEVSRLEGSLAEHSGCSEPGHRRSTVLPPYVVPDGRTLCDHLNVVKQLAASSRFIVVIPIDVIDHLDELKKDHPPARQAIRWLEAEFSKGNRYVRAQKSHEKLRSPSQLNYRRDKEAIRFAQICECCRWFGQQRGHHGSSKTDRLTTDTDSLCTMVCLLSSHKVTSSDISIRTKEVIAAALQQGLTVLSAPELLSRWRDQCSTDNS